MLTGSSINSFEEEKVTSDTITISFPIKCNSKGKQNANKVF